MARKSGRIFSWNVSAILFLGLCGGSAWSLQKQSHRGSAPTNEFTLTGSNPDARIHIDSSNTIIIINVDPPSQNQKDNQYKVGLELLAMQLCDPGAEDRLKIVYSDPSTIKTATWKTNVSFSNSMAYPEPSLEDREIKDIQVNQIVLIPEGRWTLSSADIVATLYQDSTNDGTCPPSMVPCSCTSNLLAQERPSRTRCIPKSLECNGNPNCGLQCRSDESKSTCPSSILTSFVSTTSSCSPEPPPSSPSVGSTTSQGLGDSGAQVSEKISRGILLMCLAAYLIC